MVSHPDGGDGTTNIIGGVNTDGNLRYTSPITITFVDPAHTNAPAVTSLVSIKGDVLADVGASATMEAFDVAGNSLGVDTQEDVLGGLTLVLAAPNIHRVVLTEIAPLDIPGGSIGFDFLNFYRVTPLDVTPDDFNFIPQSGVAVKSVVESNVVTLSGVVTSVPVAIQGGEYSINGAAFSAQSSMVNNGDTIKLRVTASASPSQTTTASITVGSLVKVFSVTTAAAKAPPEGHSNPPAKNSTGKKKGGGAWGVPELLSVLLVLVVGRLRNRYVSQIKE